MYFLGFQRDGSWLNILYYTPFIYNLSFKKCKIAIDFQTSLHFMLFCSTDCAERKHIMKPESEKGLMELLNFESAAVWF